MSPDNESGSLLFSSGDLIADRRFRWALDLAARGDDAAAADLLAQAIELAPRFAAAWFMLGTVRERLADIIGAAAAFEQARDADPEDTQGAGLRLALLAPAKSAPTMSGRYVRRLFDQYAARYDSALTDGLHYRAPALLHGAVEAARRAQGRSMQFRSMLDLGCGTGLAGAPFRSAVGRLVGVDLSPAMAKQAAAKGLYDRIATADLTDFLADEVARAAEYQLILAADVFVYLDDLGPVMASIARLLPADGLAAFTVETHTAEGVTLLPTLRYAHGVPYLRRVLGGASLEVAQLTQASVRDEKGDPVDSLVVVAQLSTAIGAAATSAP